MRKQGSMHARSSESYSYTREYHTISAENDIRPSWPAQQLANLIPKGEFYQVTGAAHCIWLTHYDELKELLRRSIAKIIKDHNTG